MHQGFLTFPRAGATSVLSYFLEGCNIIELKYGDFSSKIYTNQVIFTDPMGVLYKARALGALKLVHEFEYRLRHGNLFLVPTLCCPVSVLALRRADRSSREYYCVS
jgi:hypothetical protein